MIPEGLEPPTSWAVTKYSIQLSYEIIVIAVQRYGKKSLLSSVLAKKTWVFFIFFKALFQTSENLIVKNECIDKIIISTNLFWSNNEQNRVHITLF